MFYEPSIFSPCRVNTTMRLATNLVRDVPISVSAELTWPKLTSKDIVKFPMTLVDSGAVSILPWTVLCF